MSGWLRQVMFRNFPLKLLSLALAVLLYVLVRPVERSNHVKPRARRPRAQVAVPADIGVQRRRTPPMVRPDASLSPASQPAAAPTSQPLLTPP